MEVEQGAVDEVFRAAPSALFARGRSVSSFFELVLEGSSEAERHQLAEVAQAVERELTREQDVRLRACLADEAYLLEMVVLRFIRTALRPAIVRSDIADVARRVKSLARKAAEVAGDLAMIDKALGDTTAAGINLAAAWAGFAAQEVTRAIADLQKAVTQLAAARDAALPDNRRRATGARRRLSRDLLVILDGEGRDLVEAIVAAVVEAVEGRVGAGEREWVAPLVREASSMLSAEHLADET